MELERARLATHEPAGPPPGAFKGDGQFFPFEWLNEIVVSTRFENVFAIDIVAAAGHDDDPGQVELFSNRAANLEPAHFWEEQIAHDRVGPFGKRPDLAVLVVVVVFGAFANAAGMVGPVLARRDGLGSLLGQRPCSQSGRQQ